MTGSIFTSLLVSFAWLFNIICWARGFYATAKCFETKNKEIGVFERIASGIKKAFIHLCFTLADLGGVGLVRYLIGTYAAAIVPSSIIAIGVSIWLIILRGRFEKGLPLMSSSIKAEVEDNADEEDYEEAA